MSEQMRTAFLPLVLVLAVLIGASCGDDPKSGNGTEKADAASTGAPDPAPKTVEPEPPTTAEEDEELERRPLLWMVEGAPRVFLYGTIHVPDPRVTNHLPVVQQALDQSTALYTELPLDQEGLMQMQMAVMQRSALPEGKTLKELFGDALHAKVAKHMPAMAPLAMLETRKPWLIQIMLLQTLMQEHTNKAMEEHKKEVAEAGGNTEDIKPPQALDPMLFNDAKAKGKQVGGLETIDAQLDAFDNLSLEKQVEMVKESIEMIEKLKAGKEGKGSGDLDGDGEVSEFEKDPMGAMVEMWLAGDDEGFMKLFEAEIRKQGSGEESFVEALLDKRNVGMVAKICELAKAGPDKTYFMAVGAGHMPGEKGIVKLLEGRGFKVRRIELGETLPAVPEPAGAPK